MKLIEYLQDLDDDLNVFIICVNAACTAFGKGRSSAFTLEDMEEMTFFRTYARNILHSKEAMRLLADTEFLSEREEESGQGERVIFVTVSCRKSYESIRKRLMELLG